MEQKSGLRQNAQAFDKPVHARPPKPFLGEASHVDQTIVLKEKQTAHGGEGLPVSVPPRIPCRPSGQYVRFRSHQRVCEGTMLCVEEGERDDKAASLTTCTLHADRPTVLLNDAPGN
jgi:hypothetical protein